MSAAMTMHVREVNVCPVVVPLERPIRTASGTIHDAPLLLIDLLTEEGVTGRSYLFGYQTLTLKPLADLVRAMADMITNDPLAPLELNRKLRRRFTLLGRRSLIGMALSGLDMAAWDALGHAHDQPLAALLGGTPRPLRAYMGNAIGVIPPSEVSGTAAELAAEGFPAIKIRLGREAFAEDLAAVRAARQGIADHVVLMADFNQSLTVAEAIRRGRALDGEGLYWIEEPVRADDFRGCARVAEAVMTPVQIGENFTSAFDMQEALECAASDLVMVDAQQIGGVTGWLAAAAVAQVHGVEVSSHLFPEVSAHLLAVTETSGWLEYMNVADPILARPLRPSGGTISASTQPGIGLAWDADAVQKYRLA
jgi:mandelate racemase